MPDNTNAPVALGVQSTPLQNPMQTLLGIAHLQGQANQNRLFQQEVAAREAVGPLMQQSIDQTTGKLDPNKLLGLVARTPDAAFKAPEYAAFAQKQREMDLTIAQKELELAHGKLGAITAALAPLVEKGPDVTESHVIKAISPLVSGGVISAKEAATALAELPPDGPGRAEKIKHLQLQALSGSERTGLLLGQIQMVNTGGAIQPTRVNTLSGQVSPVGQPLEITPTASEKSALVETKSQTGEPQMTPRAAVAPMVGGLGTVIPKVGGTPAAVPGGARAEGAAQGLGSGRHPQSAQASLSVSAGPEPGVIGAQERTGVASAEQGIELNKAAASVPELKTALSGFESALEKFTPGKGAEWRKDAKSYINTLLPEKLASVFGFDREAIANQETANKAAAMVAAAQFKAIGGTGTNDKLDMASLTSPNSELTKMGNKEILAMLKGNADALEAKNLAWERWKTAKGPHTFAAFSADFNKNYDPRVFQLNNLPAGKDRQEFVKNLSPGEQAKVKKAHAYAVEQGWIK